jgi:uncharacterized protein YraI
VSRPAVALVSRSALVALILCTTLATPLTARAAETTVVDELNLRSGPGLGYRVLAVMPPGATVALAGDPTEGWYPVIFEELRGWAFGAYLGVGGGKGGETTRGAATVVTALLNLRRGPGLAYGVVARLPYGTIVEIISGPQGADGYSWFQVNAVDYGLGYTVGQYLDAGEGGGGPPTAAATAPETAPAPVAAPAGSGNPIIDIITVAATRYGQSPAAMIAVARCESNLDPRAVNRSSGASGLFQFLPGTWRTTPYAGESIFDPRANANAAAWMWSVGRRGEWNCR